MRATAILIVCVFGVLGGACGKKGADEQKAEPEAKAPETAPPAPPPKQEQPAPAAAKTATATLEAKNDSGVSGTVTFTENDGTVHIKAELAGLEPGDHGFHIHETGDCSAPDGKSAGGHFNPKGVAHGKPDAEVHHAGDLGNITAGADGKATKEMDANWLTLGEGEMSIANRAVIVHEKPDDFGQPTGNAGGRVACGVIKVQ